MDETRALRDNMANASHFGRSKARGPKTLQIVIWGKNTEKTGGPNKAKISYGVKIALIQTHSTWILDSSSFWMRLSAAATCGLLLVFRFDDVQQPDHRRQLGFTAEPQTDHSFGWPCSLFRPCLLPINRILKLIRYHSVQVLDEIRHLRLRESLITTLFVVCDPSFKFHVLGILKSFNRIQILGGGLAKSDWNFPNSRAGIVADCPTQV